MPVTLYTPADPMPVGQDYVFGLPLQSYADPKLHKTNPALLAGDVILYRKAAGVITRIGNLTTLPLLIAGGTEELLVTVLAAELPAGTQGIIIEFKDAAGLDWCDLTVAKSVDTAQAVGTSDLTLANITGSALFTGITSLANWLRGFMRSDAMNAAAKLEVNAGGGLYDEADDSNQAIADAMPPAPPATVTVGDLTQAALAKFVNTDTGEAAVTPGSVADFAGCNAVGFPAGAIEFTYTVLGPGAIPIEGASVWISTDNPAVNIVWRGETDAFGVARDVRNMKPFLDVGPYFFWVQHDNFTGTLPDLEVVS